MNTSIFTAAPFTRPLSLKSILWVYQVFLAMAFLVPGLLFFNLEGSFSGNVLCMFGIVLWSQVRLVHAGLAGQRRLTLMCFYAFVYVFLGVQPLLSVAAREFPNGIYLSDELVSYTIFLIALGIAAFEGGYFLGLSRSGAIMNKQETPRPLSLKMLWCGSLFATALTVVVMAYYGPGTFIALRGYSGPTAFWQREVATYAEALLVVYAVRVFASVMLFFAVYMWKSRHTLFGRRQIKSLRWVVGYLGFLNLLVSNPLSAPRLWSGSIILTVFFILMRWRGTRSFLAFSTASCLALLILFAGTDPRRMAAVLLQEETLGVATVGHLVQSSVGNLAADANFDAFAMVAATTQYTGRHGYSLGYQVLLPALFWVPRSLWGSKPISSADTVAEFKSLPNLNVSSPLWAEGYMNFGLAGLVLALFLFGWFARLCDDFHVKTAGSHVPALQTIVSSYFSANSFILLRGDLTSGTMYLQLVVVLSFMIIFVNRFFSVRAPR